MTDWAKASAPGQVGKRIVEGILQREFPDKAARHTDNVVHWLTRAWLGSPVWDRGRDVLAPTSLVGLHPWVSGMGDELRRAAATGIYKPINEYDRKTLTDDLVAHLAYGLVTGGLFAGLATATSTLSVTPRFCE